MTDIFVWLIIGLIVTAFCTFLAWRAEHRNQPSFDSMKSAHEDVDRRLREMIEEANSD